MRVIHEQEVFGVEIDDQTRCGHWHGETDIIAIKFKCCARWYPCFDCHAAVTEHAHQVWPQDEFTAKAILCGSCGHQMPIADYLSSDSSCDQCNAGFNPGCANHYHLYFAIS